MNTLPTLFAMSGSATVAASMPSRGANGGARFVKLRPIVPLGDADVRLLQLPSMVREYRSDDYSAVPKLVESVQNGLAAHVSPMLLDDGTGGAYVVRDGSHRPVGVFKPQDEEPSAPNNPRSYSPLNAVMDSGRSASSGIGGGLSSYGNHASHSHQFDSHPMATALGYGRIGGGIGVGVGVGVGVGPRASAAPPNKAVRSLDWNVPLSAMRAPALSAFAPPTSIAAGTDRAIGHLPASTYGGAANSQHSQAAAPSPSWSTSQSFMPLQNTPAARSGIPVGAAATREVLAYLLDTDGFAGVPATALVAMQHDAFFDYQEQMMLSASPVSQWKALTKKKCKVGSLQSFVSHESDCEDLPSSIVRSFAVRQVHKIAVLDIRLFNTDRHGGNVLVRDPDDSAATSVRLPSDTDALVRIASGGQQSHSAANNSFAMRLDSHSPLSRSHGDLVDERDTVQHSRSQHEQQQQSDQELLDDSRRGSDGSSARISPIRHSLPTPVSQRSPAHDLRTPSHSLGSSSHMMAFSGGASASDVGMAMRTNGGSLSADERRRALLRRSPREWANLELVPIDHGYTLPEDMAEAWFVWQMWPQAHVPFDAETKHYIASLSWQRDVRMLRSFSDGVITLDSERVLRTSTLLLQRAAAADLTPFEISEIMCRPMTDELSPLELLCQTARSNCAGLNGGSEHQQTQQLPTTAATAAATASTTTGQLPPLFSEADEEYFSELEALLDDLIDQKLMEREMVMGSGDSLLSSADLNSSSEWRDIRTPSDGMFQLDK